MPKIGPLNWDLFGLVWCLNPAQQRCCFDKSLIFCACLSRAQLTKRKTRVQKRVRNRTKQLKLYFIEPGAWQANFFSQQRRKIDAKTTQSSSAEQVPSLQQVRPHYNFNLDNLRGDRATASVVLFRVIVIALRLVQVAYFFTEM